MALDDDDKKWVTGQISGARSELRLEIAAVRQDLNDLRSEVRGGFEGMKESFATMTAAIENQTKILVETIVHERMQALVAPAGNGKPPKGGGENS